MPNDEQEHDTVPEPQIQAFPKGAPFHPRYYGMTDEEFAAEQKKEQEQEND